MPWEPPDIFEPGLLLLIPVEYKNNRLKHIFIKMQKLIILNNTSSGKPENLKINKPKGI